MMAEVRKLRAAKVALGASLLGLLAAVGLVIASFVAGLGTATGDQLSQTGTVLAIAFLVLVLVLATLVSRWRQRPE
jgi:preprotein translocase subunit SecG